MQKITCFILTAGMVAMAVMAYAENNKPSTEYVQQENGQQNNVKPHDGIEKISLHQQPDEKSPVVESMSTNQAIIPIFMQGEWTKVADPSNGNVGWVSNETLKKHGMPIVKTMMQSIKAADEAGYKVVQYLSSDPKMEEMVKKWQEERQGIQMMFNKLLEQNAKVLDTFSKELQDPAFPFAIVPIQEPVKANNTDTNKK